MSGRPGAYQSVDYPTVGRPKPAAGPGGDPAGKRCSGPARIEPERPRGIDRLYQRAVQRCARIDRELLINAAKLPTTLGTALNLLAGAALRLRESFGHKGPPWALMSCMSDGHLLAPALKT